MNKHFPLLILSLISLSAFGFCEPEGISGDASGHTFFYVRRPFISALPEKISFFRTAPFSRECGIQGAYQVVPLGGMSVNGRDLGRYFSFCNKDDLSVGNFQNNQSGILADVNPTHFGISYGDNQGTYSSTIQFRPQQTFVGVGLQYRQFIVWDACRHKKRWWIDIEAPIIRVRNDMKLTETNVITSGANNGGPDNMVEAFTGQKEFAVYGIGSTTIIRGRLEKGKIEGPQSATRLQNIELKLGYNWIQEDNIFLFSYYGADIPTGNTPNADFLFEPIVGNNHHFGFMSGGYAGFQSHCWRGFTVWGYVALNSRFFIKNTQRRLVPVKFRPWSQYMLVYKDDADAASGLTTPGANIFARKVHVHPRFAHNFSLSLAVDYRCFEVELGYNFWARQAEKVSLDEQWEETQSFAALALVGPNGNQLVADQTNRLSNIGNNASPLNTVINLNTRINTCDLDLVKAAHPAALTHTMYATMGYRTEFNYPVFFAAGASYEFTGINTALNRWTVWGKFGVSI